MPQRTAFLEIQRAQFDHVDWAHFRWQTENPVLRRTERELLVGQFFAPRRLLEVGCGEGANLVRLFADGAIQATLSVGVDLFYRKVRFASEQVPAAAFVCADAHALPFREGAFDAILCRDVLHHVEDPARVVAELARLCAPGGQVVFLEPNRLNPLMLCLALLRPFERGILKSTAGNLRAVLGARFPTLTIEYRQPFPISRLILHYQFGLAKLGYVRWVGSLLRAGEGLVALLIPRRWWGYLCVTATTPRLSEGG